MLPGRYQESIISSSLEREAASALPEAARASHTAAPNAASNSTSHTPAGTGNDAPQGFNTLGLLPELLRAIEAQGYNDPTPVQARSIPVVLAGRDLLAAAQTGTGKTAGFTLPLLQRLQTTAPRQGQGQLPAPRAQGGKPPRRGAPLRPVRALILTPTRELCAQVEDSVRTYGKFLKLKSTTVYGGVGFHPQVMALSRGVDILVATPGRLLDHIEQRTVDLSGIEILVLDEADRMLDMGFIHDIRRIHALLPRQRQTMLFSATFSQEIRALSTQFLTDPESVEVARRNAPIELVTQVVHPVDKDRKRELLAHLVKSNDWRQVLVFCKTKHGANRLAELLERDGIESDAIHGNKSQPARMRALKRFKDNELQVLVATDIAARGIDIDALPHVVNYDLPNVPEDYVHRIGRTGRAGATGDAVSLVCAEDRPLLGAIERLIATRVPQQVIAGFEPKHRMSGSPSERNDGRKPSSAKRQGGNRPGSGNASRGNYGNNANRDANGNRRSGNGNGNTNANANANRDRSRDDRGNRVADDARRAGPAPRPGKAPRKGPRGNAPQAPASSWELERRAQVDYFRKTAQTEKSAALFAPRKPD